MSSRDKDPTVSFMTLDITARMLELVSDLPALCEFLAAQVRELSGARLVVIIQCANERDDHQHHVLVANPRRRQHVVEEPCFDTLVERIHELKGGHAFMTPDCCVECGEFFEQHGFLDNLAVPLNAGENRVGAMLCLGIHEDAQHYSLAETLLPLGGIAALAMRCSKLVLDQKQQIKSTFEQLRQRDTHYNLLVENQNDLVIQFAEDGKLTYCSPSYCEAMGKSEDELVGHSFFDHACGDPERAKSILAELAEPPHHVEYEEKTVVQGETRWYSWRARAIVEHVGEMGTIVSVGRDVTKERAAEEALLQSEERHRIISSITSDYVYALDIRRDGHFAIAWTSGAFEQICGYSIDEINSMREGWITIVNDSDLIQFMPEIQANMELVEAKRYEYRITRKDGEIVWLSDNIQPIWSEEEGRIVQLLGGVQDISARKHAEEALIASEKKYRALIENSPDVVMTFDRNCRHLFVSENVTRALPFTAHQMIGKTPAELGFPEDLCGLWSERVKQCWDSEASLTEEFRMPKAYGGLWFHWRLIPEYGESGEVEAVLSICQDVTEKRRVEENYQSLFHQMLDGFAVHDIVFDEDGAPCDYRFIAVNPAFEELTGLQAADIIGRRVLEVLPATENYWIEVYGRVALTGEPIRFQQFAQELGKHWEVLAYRPQEGQFACVFQDVTERVKAHNQLKHTASLLAEAEKVAAMSSWEWYPDSGRVVWSDGVYQILGLDRSRSPGEQKLWADVAYPDDLPVVERLMEDILSQGEAETECRICAPDGHVRWISAKGRVEQDSDPLRVLGIVQDVTERKAAEQALNAERDFTSAILNTAGALVVVLDLEGNIIRFNKACENTTGYTFDEVRGRKVWDSLVVPDEVDAMRHIWQHRGLSTFPSMIEGQWLTKDGKHRLIAWSNTDLGQGDDAYIVSIGLDITEQRRAEERAELHKEQLVRADKLASLGTLVAGMAHEINNPNNFIMMNLANLRDIWDGTVAVLDRHAEAEGDFDIKGIPYAEVSEHMQDLMAGLTDGAQRIKHIVQDLRTYARDESSDMNQTVDINDVLRSTLVLLGNLIKKSTKHLSISYCECSPVVKGNFQRMEQVFVNIVQNACQALSSDTQAIQIHIHCELSDVVVTVRDEGVGIAPDNLRDILDPFYTTKRDTGGSGLGLSICAGIVEEHKGEIEFASTVGEGTTAVVRLPMG